MKDELTLPEVLSFEWDKGNLLKSKIKHKVESLECEQVFHNDPIYAHDPQHSKQEVRYLTYGLTDQGRQLFIVFTIRGNSIRVISARDQSRKERRCYEKAQSNPEI